MRVQQPWMQLLQYDATAKKVSWSHWFSLRSQAWTDQYCWQQLRPPEIASQEGPGLITFSLQLLGVSFSIWAHQILDDPHQTKQLTRRPYLLTPFKQNYALPEMHLQLGPPVFQRLQLVGFFSGHPRDGDLVKVVPVTLEQTPIWKGNSSSNHPSPKSYEFLVSGCNGAIIHPTINPDQPTNPWKPHMETMAPPRSSQAFLQLRGPPRIRYHCANAYGVSVDENPKEPVFVGYI